MKIYRSSENIDRIEPASFLSRQNMWPQLYVKKRNSQEERIILGSIHSSRSYIDPSTAACNIPVYTAQSFFQEDTTCPLWEKYPNTIYFVPKYEIIQTETQTTLFSYWQDGSDHSEKLDFPLSASIEKKKLSLASRVDVPCQTSWEKSVEKALLHIENKMIDKVVLARRTDLISTDLICPYHLIWHLQATQTNTSLFLVSIDGSSFFLGSSPEKLYQRDDQSLQTEALAGTMPRGKDPHHDASLQQELLQCEKLLKEVSCVENFLNEKLDHIASAIECDTKYTIKQTPSVQHLYKKIQCTLLSPFSDEHAIKLIHPTPALAGLPQKEAMDFIRHNELLDRGWYGGILGYYTKGEADFIVSIRCCLVQNRTLSAFAGAGIVQGSNPLQEWAELNNKIQHYREYFS